MKKLVFASVMALAGLGLVLTHQAAAQAGGQTAGQISLPPEQYNAYQNAVTQSNPQVKAADLETFLQTYPQTPVKKSVLDALMDTYYQGLHDPDKALSAATRLLQIDPNNLKALYFAVSIKKSQCGNNNDQQTCDDAAALAQKGLTAPKPDGTSDADWKNLTNAAYPVFHSAIALDDAIKKDYKGAEDEYKAELMLFTDDQTKTPAGGLVDELQLAHVYAMPGPSQDLVKSVWFYARVWDFAPPAYQAKIEPQLEYYYKKYHGGLDGLDALKQQAQATTFPPGTLTITPAKSPQEQIHDLIAATPDLSTLALADKETVLAAGSKDDADKVWAIMQGKPTPVPGTVISADANTIKVAVSQDAKDAKTPDFIVTMKEPLKDAEIPAAGTELGLSSNSQPELDATYSNYTQVPATTTTAAAAQIELSDGVLVPVRKTPEHHRPPAAHHHTTPQ